MGKYTVIVPFAGEIILTLEASSPEDAISKAVYSTPLHVDIECADDSASLDYYEWDTYKTLSQGNIWYVSTVKDAHVEKADD